MITNENLSYTSFPHDLEAADSWEAYTLRELGAKKTHDNSAYRHLHHEKDTMRRTKEHREKVPR